MKNNSFINILLNGQRRVFFLLFAFALLAQIFIFARQNALQAISLIHKDFKIVLSYNASEEKQESLQNVLKHLNGITNFKKLSSQDIFDIFSKGAKGTSDYVLNPAFVPALYEVEVNQQVMLDTENWLKNNLYNFDENLEVYYKTRQNQVALYLKAFVKYLDILAILVILSLISFGFFVEAYYIRISTAKERIAGILCGLGAGLFALACRKILLTYLVFTFPYQNQIYKEQLIIIFLAMALGGTLSKWKRF
jgi:cell division protein FtsX